MLFSLFFQLSFSEALIWLDPYSLMSVPVLCHYNVELSFFLRLCRYTIRIARVIFNLSRLINLKRFVFDLRLTYNCIGVEEVLFLLTPSICFVSCRDVMLWTTSLLWPVSFSLLLVEIPTCFRFSHLKLIVICLGLSMFGKVLLCSLFQGKWLRFFFACDNIVDNISLTCVPLICKSCSVVCDLRCTTNCRS